MNRRGWQAARPLTHGALDRAASAASANGASVAVTLRAPAAAARPRTSAPIAVGVAWPGWRQRQLAAAPSWQRRLAAAQLRSLAASAAEPASPATAGAVSVAPLEFRASSTAEAPSSHGIGHAGDIGAAAPLSRREAGQDGAWSHFCVRWNDTLSRRPVAMVIFFSAVGTLTWGVLFGSLLLAAPAMLSMPEYAVGWLVMRTTSRLRMPLNAALAAPLAALAPALSKLKISPLLAAFAADPQTNAAIGRARVSIEESPRLSEGMQRMVRQSFAAMSTLKTWLEGPIDKFGLPYFLCSKATSVATLCGATAAASSGLDVSGALTAWGFSDDLQNDAGFLAAAAALNVGCIPLHFAGAVRSVHFLEDLASRMFEERQSELQELRRSYERQAKAAAEAKAKAPAADADAAAAKAEAEEEEEEPLTKQEVTTNLVNNVSLFVVMLDLAVMMYVMRRLSASASSGATADESGSDAAFAATAASEEASLPAAEAEPSSSDASAPAASGASL
eukprot:TRINITY_DN7673_c0_g1_i1.p1 TRINITY_DN7673_c0_g1~~TRINITY_DN7673_c0_g1_i1.p1  ORF type:complete len:505 (-),score=147.45 TRINITY_DN7673_c0_g1_i1:68-1582(-)